MPHDEEILGLKDYKIKEIRRDGGGVALHVRYTGRVACPHCDCTSLRKKDRFVRQLRHETWGQRCTTLHLDSLKFLCLGCGKYFNQRFPGVLPRRRSTEVFRRYIFRQHYDGVNRKRLAIRQKIGQATAERWFQDYIVREVSTMKGELCPTILGIDEHFFTRKKGFATTFCDLKHHKVYDVVLGRSEAALEGYFRSLRGKEKVKVVCIDLSSSYRSLIRKHFPNAKIVADRFHVIRLVNYHFMATWRLLDPVASKSRGLVSLMRRHRKKLKPHQVPMLQDYLDKNPHVKTIYEFKQKLTALLCQKTATAKTCKRYHAPRLIKMIKELKSSGLPQLETLGRTLDSWSQEIACMWRFSKNNGITEGFHNKMETISRMAYGFRNFQNYRLRIRAMCS